jgi:GTP-binding protein
MIDRVKIRVQGGDGGSGSVSFRREKFVPKGGPDGGDGGNGGSVWLVVAGKTGTLADFRRKRVYRADKGGFGQGSNKHGRNGSDLLIEVPPGTVVRRAGDGDSLEIIGDLTEPGQRLRVARGGKRGRGNARFATSTNQAPRIAEKGGKGEDLELVLDLKLISDVGIIGLPNAGKSTLLRAVSAARPKVAEYPFTTLEPVLGVVEIGYESLVLADIPGLIEGAHSGSGLGLDFLRHIERTRVVIHLVDGSRPHPEDDISTVNSELAAYSAELAAKRQVLAVNKVDLPEVRERKEAMALALRALGHEPLFISAVTRRGVKILLDRVLAVLAEERAKAVEPAATPPVLRPPARGPRFVITKREGVYEVEGERITDLVERFGVETEEAQAEIRRRLARLGVAAALRRAGARPGDRILIGGEEIEWQG